MNSPQLEKYLKTRAVSGPWRIEGCTGGRFAGAVVIPALAEGERLFKTLASLATNPPDILDRFLVLVAINQRTDTPLEDKEDNRNTLQKLAGGIQELFPLRLAWVDASSPGFELPAKGGGVGLARKIGLDLALSRLEGKPNETLLICLDADTLVEPSYLTAIVRHFQGSGKGGAAIPFRHQPGRSPEEQQAIDLYELFLRHYIFGLGWAGSPYAFQTVGSAMACTSDAYVKSGGMNTRTAGEDFYFLQHLSRTVGVANLAGTTVYPSARPSHRVPFGTGRSVSRWLGGDGEAITFYRPECFRILKEWLQVVSNSPFAVSSEILEKCPAISNDLLEYLERIDFPGVWQKLCRNNPFPDRLLNGFHSWFDALKTMKLIHHLSANGLPRCGPEEAIPGLLKMTGIEVSGNILFQLDLLRGIEAEKLLSPCNKEMVME